MKILEKEKKELSAADHRIIGQRLDLFSINEEVGTRQFHVSILDGMKVDVQGNLYATQAAGVWVLSKDGTNLGSIKTPERPANLGWGGENWKTLYLTARTSLYRVKLNIPGVKVF